MPQSLTSAIALKPAHDFRQAIFAVLDGTAKEIKRFAAALHNRCPLVVYIDKAGRTCSQFLKRSAFTGYHFKFAGGTATVTNKETGAQYKVNLSPSFPFCTCPAFKYSPLPKQPCKHIAMVAQKRGDLEQVASQQTVAIAPEYTGINEKDLPDGCLLHRTEDWLSREYELFIHINHRVNGVPTPGTKCVGRLIEGANSIEAYKLRSGVYRSFATTMDAVRYLVSTSGHSLSEVAEAFRARKAPTEHLRSQQQTASTQKTQTLADPFGGFDF